MYGKLAALLTMTVLATGIAPAAFSDNTAATNPPPQTPGPMQGQGMMGGQGSGQPAAPMMGGGTGMMGMMMEMMMGGTMMGQEGARDGSPMMGNGTNMMGMMMGMMRGGPGGAMGVALANAPGPRVPQSAEKTLATAVPAGATVDRPGNAIAFSTDQVRFTMLADSDDSAGDNRMFFEIAGLRNPTITVPAGATVTVQFVNADDDQAHILAFSRTSAPIPFMAMMNAWPAFSGAESPVLGNPTAAGLHSATFTFVASEPGGYTYLCLIAGHAQQGMLGRFVVAKTAP